MTIVYLIVLGIFFFWITNLSNRILDLERKLGQKSVPAQEYKPQNLTQTTPSEVVQRVNVQNQTFQPVSNAVYEKSAFEKFVDWLKEEWLLKLGIFLVLLGIGWFVTYAFANNWIGPKGRITLGLGAGILILIFGYWRIRHYLYQGGVFLVFGSTTIILTLFAAREVYQFFTPVTALAIMFLSTALVALISVKYKTQALAIASLVLATSAPFFVNITNWDYPALFLYLLIVVMGVIWIVNLTAWRVLVLIALLIMSAYSAPHFLNAVSTDQGILIIFAYIFTAIFFVSSVASILRYGQTLAYQEKEADTITIIGNGIFLWFWIWTAVAENWQSLILSAWTIVFLVGGFLVFRKTQYALPFYAFSAVGVSYIATATAITLDGSVLIIALVFEILALVTVSMLAIKNISLAKNLTWLMIAPMVLSLQSFEPRKWLEPINEHFFVLLILGLSLSGLGIYFYNRTNNQIDNSASKQKEFEVILIMFGSLYLYALVWYVLHALNISDDTATMISLFIYTLIGLSAYFYGKFNTKKVLVIYGAILLVFVVGRLLLIDVWHMELAGRVVTFIVIGILLISTAFIKSKKKDNELYIKV